MRIVVRRSEDVNKSLPLIASSITKTEFRKLKRAGLCYSKAPLMLVGHCSFELNTTLFKRISDVAY